jgi:RND family efflux transporter MFP subunit
MMNHWKIFLFLVPFLPAALAGCSGRSADAQEMPGEYAAPIRVQVLKPTVGGLERTTVQPATVQSFEFVGLFAQVSGVLENQNVDIGSRVKKGQVLAEILAPELIKEQAQAVAALEQAKAQVIQTEKHEIAAAADLDSTRKLVDQREFEKKSKEAYHDFRSKELKRFEELVKSDVIDARTLDEEKDRCEAALSAWEAAKAAVETARFDVNTKRAKVEEASANIIAAKANVRVAEAALGKADVFVKFTKIVAPFDGIVSKRNYNNGDFIRLADRGGQLPLLVVQRRDKMRVIVQIPDTDAPYVNEGNPVEVRITSLGKHGIFPGTVSRLSYVEDEKSRTMQVEVDLANKNRYLRHGMYGDITIHLQGTPEKALTLPASCLRRDGPDSPSYVFVVRKKTAHKVEVRVDFNNAIQAEIVDGLDPGSQVVINPNGLVDGSPVEVVK